ncbi:MAG: leucine-rich repeat domain-containing protein [candidate division Zixibacteria bacterium]|nr:leucine-rich repeat domain-containing protein [candidate division Zixibacteria bacterium]
MSSLLRKFFIPVLTILVGVVFITCSERILDESKGLETNFQIDVGLAKVISEHDLIFRVIITADDMETIIAPLDLVDGFLVGTVENVPAGVNRKLTLQVISFDLETVFYEGVVFVTITAGATVENEVTLFPVPPTVRLSPRFQELDSLATFSLDVRAHNFDGLAQVEYYLIFDTTKLQIIGLPSLGGGASKAQQTDSSLFGVIYEIPIITDSAGTVITTHNFLIKSPGTVVDSFSIDLSLLSISTDIVLNLDSVFTDGATVRTLADLVIPFGIPDPPRSPIGFFENYEGFFEFQEPLEFGIAWLSPEPSTAYVTKGFNIYKSTGGVFQRLNDFLIITSESDFPNLFVFADLSLDTTSLNQFQYYVTTVSTDDIESKPSDTVSVTPASVLERLRSSSITGLSPKDCGFASLTPTFSWDPVNDAESYVIVLIRDNFNVSSDSSDSYLWIYRQNDTTVNLGDNTGTTYISLQVARLDEDVLYEYEILAVDAGNVVIVESDARFWTVGIDGFTGITKTNEIGDVLDSIDPRDWCVSEFDTFLFAPAFPNPATSSVTLQFGTREQGHVAVRIYKYFNGAAKVIRTLYEDSVGLIGGVVTWDLTDNTETRVPPGIYRAVFETEFECCYGDIEVRDTVSPPILLSPENGDVLDNSCNDGEVTSDSVIWNFDWSDVSGATVYELFIKNNAAQNPVIDTFISPSSFHSSLGGFISNANLLDWRWKVRAMVGGVWSAFSPERTFDVEPLNTDCPRLVVSPDTLFFTAIEFGNSPPAQTFTVDRDPSGPAITFETFHKSFWLIDTPRVGITPATVSITVNPADLSAGLYTEVIDVSSPQVANSSERVYIRFEVTAPEDPTVTFPDPFLDAIIRDALGRSGGDTLPIFKSEVETIDTLDASGLLGRFIIDLTGLENLTGLKSLDLNNNTISDISPLNGLTGLTTLDLGSNQISDVSPLAGLTGLSVLSLSVNQISDITPLAGLTGLTFLRMAGNQIINITSLAGLTDLTVLDLKVNQIIDITPLSGLTLLFFLELTSNQIIDINPLAGMTVLATLRSAGNQIIDISSLAGLTELSLLLLDNNQIADITPLANNDSLALGDIVKLRDNPLSAVSIDSLISVLTARGVNVTSNYLITEPDSLFFERGGTATGAKQAIVIGEAAGNFLGSIQAAADSSWIVLFPTENPNFLEVEVDTTGLPPGTRTGAITVTAAGAANSPVFVYVELTITEPSDPTVTFPDSVLDSVIREALGRPPGDTAPIFKSQVDTINTLEARGSSGRKIIDLSGLENLTGLVSLNLSLNQISDISPLAGLTGLTDLDLNINNIADISSLSGLTGLITLDLGQNEISDISPLAGLTGLITLELRINQIMVISPLAGMTSLTNLDLLGNQIIDISPIAGLTGLVILSLPGNQIIDISPLAGLTGLAQLQLGVNQIIDVTPLAGLTGLALLDLQKNQIMDITSLNGLTGLNQLVLEFNQIIDIAPLLANSGLGGGDLVNISSNPLDSISINSHITALRIKGVNVISNYLLINPVEFTFAVDSGGCIFAAQQFFVQEAGGNNLVFNVVENLNWLSLGSLSGRTPATITVFVDDNAAAIAAGSGSFSIAFIQAGSASQSLQVNVTSIIGNTATITGTVIDAVGGGPLVGASVSLTGTALGATTDINGFYTIALVPAGNYEIRASLIGHFVSTKNICVAGGGSSEVNFALSATLISGQYRFVLTWNLLPFDLDAHVWTGGFHTYWCNSFPSSAPNVAVLDLDDIDSFGPETMTLDSLSDTCRFAVHNYSQEFEGDIGLPLSGARIEVFEGQNKIATFDAPSLSNGPWWHVFNILPDGSLDTVNTTDVCPPILFNYCDDPTDPSCVPLAAGKTRTDSPSPKAVFMKRLR